MTSDSNNNYIKRHRMVIMAVLCLFGLFMAQSAPALQQKRKSRPRKTAQKDNRVYLVHADVLHYDEIKNPEAQILNGNVQFRHNGATLYCDSAYFYEASNSFEAFGKVRMVQGDTLTLVSKYAFYDGNEQMAEARHEVVLTHRRQKLYTDSLNYDRLYNIGYFFEGGKLVDGNTTLTSDWGEYHTDTRMAVFNYNVRLRDKKMLLTGDTLYYDTGKSLAHAVGPSVIKSGASTINTEDGYYNTKTEQSEMYGRSVMNDGGKTLIGDSVYHDSKKDISEAFGNVVYVDTVNKNKLTSDYGWYDGEKGYAMVTKRAVAIDYSQQDSLFMHADTFKIFTFNINTDSVYRKIHAYNKVRAYRIDVQAVCDSLVYNSLDSCMTMYKDPIVWNNNQQLLGEEIKVYMKDSTVNWAHVINQALSVERLIPDSTRYNQVSSKEMKAFFDDGNIREAHAIDNVLAIFFPIDDADSTIILENYLQTTLMKVFFNNRKMQKVWAPKSEGDAYPLSQIPPDRRQLPAFAWFDYIRPLNKDDIFEWRGKKGGLELKPEKRREAPVRHLE
ncbi:MAG: OstA-like protein [Prevotella sp.]|nr:OstA-like protein [Prevotella sp.]